MAIYQEVLERQAMIEMKTEVSRNRATNFSNQVGNALGKKSKYEASVSANGVVGAGLNALKSAALAISSSMSGASNNVDVTGHHSQSPGAVVAHDDLRSEFVGFTFKYNSAGKFNALIWLIFLILLKKRS